MFGKKNQVKKKLKQNLSDISGLRATYLPQKVLLINKDFYDGLIEWLTKRGKSPKNFDTNKLLSNGKLKPNIKRGKEYEIINPNIWPDIIEKFGPMQKIEAILLQNPTTGREMIFIPDSSMLKFNIYLPSKYNLNNLSSMPIQYYSSPDWLLRDIKKKICSSYSLDPTALSFARHESRNSEEQISEKFKMEVVAQSYSTDLDLRQSKSPTIQSFKKSTTSSTTNFFDFEQTQSSRPNTNRKTKTTKITSTKTETEKIDTSKTAPPKKTVTSQPPSTSTSPKKSKSQLNSNEKIEAINGRTSNYTKSSLSPSVANFAYPKPVGLRNLGNTCFFNAAVQCLVRVMPLTSFILSDRFFSQLNPRNENSSGGSIARSYRKLLESFCSASSSSSSSALDPSNLRWSVVSKYTRFSDHGQHDSQELLISLLDGLHEDMNQARPTKSNASSGRVSDGWSLHLSRNSSPIVDIFHGVLCSCITCPNCGHIEEVHDPFVFLSLPIQRRLEDCLSRFSQGEKLDAKNKWKCEKCKKLVCAIKETGIEKCGKKALIIHLKRFSGDGQFGSKIDTPVDYPDILDIGKFAKNDNGKFRLIGAVFHSGGLSGGHYTAAAVDPGSNSWYLFNDSMTSKISCEKAHSRAAYILFYQRIE